MRVFCLLLILTSNSWCWTGHEHDLHSGLRVQLTVDRSRVFLKLTNTSTAAKDYYPSIRNERGCIPWVTLEFRCSDGKVRKYTHLPDEGSSSRVISLPAKLSTLRPGKSVAAVGIIKEFSLADRFESNFFRVSAKVCIDPMLRHRLSIQSPWLRQK